MSDLDDEDEDSGEQEEPRRPPQYGEVYLPLQDGRFRVLRLDPGMPGDLLRGELTPCPLRHVPRYRALSYCWGPPEYEKTLHLPGSGLGMTASLDAALRRLRRPTRSILVWADAVCINQQDSLERSAQVARMAVIYRNADSVAVWLGEETPTDALAFWLIDFLQCLRLQHLFRLDEHLCFVEDREAVYAELQTQFLAKRSQSQQLTALSSLLDAFSALGALFQRSWFRRQWVLQEVSLAHECVFYCGRLSCSMRAMLNASQLSYAINVNTFDEHSLLGTVMKTVKVRDWNHAKHFLYEMVDAWRRDRCLSRKWQFLEAVISGVDSLGCSDPRDRIWSLRAMHWAHDKHQLYPDYAKIKSVDLYTRLAATVLTTPDDGTDSSAVLLALAGADRRKRPTRLPSWVPYLNAKRPLSATTNIMSRMALYTNNSEHKFSGGLRRDLRAWYAESEPKVLKIEGVLLDPIASICEHSRVPQILSSRYYQALRLPRKRKEEIATQEVLQWYLQCRTFALTALARHPVRQAALIDSFDTFLIQDPTIHPIIEDFEPLGEHMDAIFAQVIENVQAIDTSTFVPPLDVWHMRRDLTPFLQPLQTVDYFLDLDRVLAVTGKRMLGWIPDTSRVGDYICLFTGAPTPFVVRSVGDGNTFEMVGDAYVHGAMYGEAWEKYGSRAETLRLV